MDEVLAAVIQLDIFQVLQILFLCPKAELLQLKPHPFICMRNFINEKVGNRKN